MAIFSEYDQEQGDLKYFFDFSDGKHPRPKLKFDKVAYWNFVINNLLEDISDPFKYHTELQPRHIRLLQDLPIEVEGTKFNEIKIIKNANIPDNIHIETLIVRLLFAFGHFQEETFRKHQDRICLDFLTKKQCNNLPQLYSTSIFLFDPIYITLSYIAYPPLSDIKYITYQIHNLCYEYTKSPTPGYPLTLEEFLQPWNISTVNYKNVSSVIPKYDPYSKSNSTTNNIENEIDIPLIQKKETMPTNPYLNMNEGPIKDSLINNFNYLYCTNIFFTMVIPKNINVEGCEWEFREFNTLNNIIRRLPGAIYRIEPKSNMLLEGASHFEEVLMVLPKYFSFIKEPYEIFSGAILNREQSITNQIFKYCSSYLKNQMKGMFQEVNIIEIYGQGENFSDSVVLNAESISNKNIFLNDPVYLLLKKYILEKKSLSSFNINTDNHECVNLLLDTKCDYDRVISLLKNLYLFSYDIRDSRIYFIDDKNQKFGYSTIIHPKIVKEITGIEIQLFYLQINLGYLSKKSQAVKYFTDSKKKEIKKFKTQINLLNFIKLTQNIFITNIFKDKNYYVVKYDRLES